MEQKAFIFSALFFLLFCGNSWASAAFGDAQLLVETVDPSVLAGKLTPEVRGSIDFVRDDLRRAQMDENGDKYILSLCLDVLARDLVGIGRTLGHINQYILRRGNQETDITERDARIEALGRDATEERSPRWLINHLPQGDKLAFQRDVSTYCELEPDFWREDL